MSRYDHLSRVIRKHEQRVLPASNPPLPKKRATLKRYGLTPQQYDRMIHDAGVRCAICFQAESPDEPLHIDHDHRTGAVRGILCRMCNMMLGFAKDDLVRLERAIAYLRRGPLDLIDYAKIEAVRNRLSEPFRSAAEAKSGVRARATMTSNTLLNHTLSDLRTDKT